MAAVKSSGLGDRFYIGGYNISGDVGSLGNISGGNSPLEVTDITQSGMDRLGGLRNGTVEFNCFYDDQSGQEHPGLKTLLTTDRITTYFRGTTIGNPAASMVAKQINYDPTRGTDGSLTLAVQTLSNQYGLEWGQNLSGGTRNDTGATNGSSIDTGGSLSFGAQAYLQVIAFSGTDVTVKIQDSADDVSFADISPALNFAQITLAPSAERISVVNTTTIRRYLRAITVTTGGFSSLQFACMVVKNAIAGQVF